MFCAVLFFLCHGTVLCVTLFFLCVIVLFVVIYSLLLVMYVYLTVYIVLLTLPPGVNPVAVNKYILSVCLPIYLCLSVLMFACLSVRPHETTLLPLDGFLRNLIRDSFSKICRGDQSVLQSDKNNGYIVDL